MHAAESTVAPLKVELVTHCFQYASLLKYQLSSLVLWPPQDLHLTVTVFYTKEDATTKAVLDWFGAQAVKNITWHWWEMPRNQLCRRGIGRNLAALASKADWVWFADADHWFGQECWSALAGIRPESEPLIYPRRVLTHKTHELGDVCIARAQASEGLVSADRKDFAARRMNRAIGGIQITSGELCRNKGYMKDSRKVQRPVKSGNWVRTWEDSQVRAEWGTAGIPVNLPQVYRIRHSQAGRHHPGLSL